MLTVDFLFNFRRNFCVNKCACVSVIFCVLGVPADIFGEWIWVCRVMAIPSEFCFLNGLVCA